MQELEEPDVENYGWAKGLGGEFGITEQFSTTLSAFTKTVRYFLHLCIGN